MSLIEFTELIMAVFTGVLISIFLSALFMIIFVLHRKTRRATPSNRLASSISIPPEITLLKSPPVTKKDSSNSSFMDEVYESLDAAQDDPRWADKASTMITHCMAVLVNCRALTEKLTGIAMNMMDEWDPQMNQLVEIAKVITLRVDQLVSCMYPPLNSQVLEARAASLTLAVTHLAIVTQYECDKIPVEWVSKILNNIQRHIDMLNCESDNSDHSKENLQILNGHTFIHT